jgi:hypothetical protein
MKRLNSFLLLALLACAPTVSAQTRPARPAPNRTAAPAARPTPTPAPQTPAPAAATASAPAPTPHPCGCEDKPLPEVLAVVNGVRITRADISPQTQQRIEQLQQEVADARKRELNLQINSLLLEAEAKKRGISSVKLIEDEVIAKFVHPTDADVQTFFDQNKARIEAQAGRAIQLSEVRENILSYLRDQRQQDEAKKLAERLRAAYDVKVLVTEATPPATPADRARRFATVNGRPITSADIEDSLRPLVFSVQEQVYDLRKKEVDLKINDALLSQEAQKRGVTTDALLNAEVITKVPAVTEAQAQAFYNENKERINGEFAQVKEQIIQYLREQEGRKAETAFAGRLRQAAGVQTFLTAPEPPRFDIATDDQEGQPERHGHGRRVHRLPVPQLRADPPRPRTPGERDGRPHPRRRPRLPALDARRRLQGRRGGRGRARAGQVLGLRRRPLPQPVRAQDGEPQAVRHGPRPRPREVRRGARRRQVQREGAARPARRPAPRRQRHSHPLRQRRPHRALLRDAQGRHRSRPQDRAPGEVVRARI